MSIAKQIVIVLAEAVIEGKVAVKDVETTGVSLAKAYVAVQAVLNATPASKAEPIKVSSGWLCETQAALSSVLSEAAQPAPTSDSAASGADSSVVGTVALAADSGIAPTGSTATDAAASLGAPVADNNAAPEAPATPAPAPAAADLPVSPTDPVQVAIAAVNAAIAPAAAPAPAPAVVTQ